MDPQRLIGPDRLLAHGLSRRRVLGALGGIAVMGISARSTGAGVAAARLATVDPNAGTPALRDFAAPAAALALSPAMEGFAVTDDLTIFSKEAAERAQVFPAEVLDRLYGDSQLWQIRSNRFISADESEVFYVKQFQFPDQASAAIGSDTLSQTLDYSGAQDLTGAIFGDESGFARRFTFQTNDGQEIDRINTVAQHDEIVVTGTYDIIGTEPANGSEWSEDWHRNANGDLLGAYDDDQWGGVAGPAAQETTRWMPAMEGVTWLQSYLGIVNGDPLRRYGQDAESIAAENPGVVHAQFGNYSLGGGPFPITVYFGVRSFEELLRSDEYWDQLESLMANNRSGVRWTLVDTSTESGFPHLEHAGAWNPAEGVQFVGAHIAAQIGTNVIDIGAFTQYSGDPATFADIDPSGEGEYDPLRGGLASMFGSIHPRSEWVWRSGHLPAEIPRPAKWE